MVLLTKENRLPECTTEVIKKGYGKILLLPRNFLNPEVSLQIISFVHKKVPSVSPSRWKTLTPEKIKVDWVL